MSSCEDAGDDPDPGDLGDLGGTLTSNSPLDYAQDLCHDDDDDDDDDEEEDTVDFSRSFPSFHEAAAVGSSSASHLEPGRSGSVAEDSEGLEEDDELVIIAQDGATQRHTSPSKQPDGHVVSQTEQQIDSQTHSLTASQSSSQTMAGSESHAEDEDQSITVASEKSSSGQCIRTELNQSDTVSIEISCGKSPSQLLDSGVLCTDDEKRASELSNNHQSGSSVVQTGNSQSGASKITSQSVSQSEAGSAIGSVSTDSLDPQLLSEEIEVDEDSLELTREDVDVITPKVNDKGWTEANSTKDTKTDDDETIKSANHSANGLGSDRREDTVDMVDFIDTLQLPDVSNLLQSTDLKELLAETTDDDNKCLVSAKVAASPDLILDSIQDRFDTTAKNRHTNGAATTTVLSSQMQSDVSQESSHTQSGSSRKQSDFAPESGSIEELNENDVIVSEVVREEAAILCNNYAPNTQGLSDITEEDDVYKSAYRFTDNEVQFSRQEVVVGVAEVQCLPKPPDVEEEVEGMDVEGNVGVEYCCHTSPEGGREESMEVDRGSSDDPDQVLAGVVNGNDNLMTASIHSHTGQIMEVVGVPPTLSSASEEQLDDTLVVSPVPVVPPLEHLSGALADDTTTTSDDSAKLETPRKKARPGTPKRHGDKRGAGAEKPRPGAASPRSREATPSKATPTTLRRSSKSSETSPKVSPRETIERRKSLAKVQSKIGEYLQKPATTGKSTTKKDAEKSSAAKIVKPVTPKKKEAPVSLADHPQATSTPRRPSLQRPSTVKARAGSAEPSRLKSSSADRSTSKTSEAETSQQEKKPLKRVAPKSKWDNITSTINNGKAKETAAAKSRLAAAPAAARNPGTSAARRLSEASASSKLSTPAGRGKPGGRAAALSASTSHESVRSRTSSTRGSPDPAPTPGGAGRGRRVSAPAPPPTGRPGSAGAGRTGSLRAARSDSVCSEVSSVCSDTSSTLSRTSTVSTQAAGTGASIRGATPEPLQKPPAKVAPLKRRSLIPPATVAKVKPEVTRRSSLPPVKPATSKTGTKTPAKDPSSKKAKDGPGPGGPRSSSKPSPAPGGSTSTKAAAAASLKRPHQPDVVTTSLGGGAAAADIARLESLVAARTAELTAARRRVTHAAAGFSAMAAVVRYLTEQLDAFSCPEVTTKLADTQQQLSKAQQYLTELTVQRDALVEEIASVKAAAAAELEAARGEGQRALRELEERLSQDSREQVQTLKTNHESEVKEIKSAHETHVDELKLSHAEALKERAGRHQEQLQQQQQEHRASMHELEQHHETQLQDITVRFEHIKTTLMEQEKLEYLRGECESMREREKTYMEACRRDSELKIQVAVAPYKHLPAEVESLKTVLELRNEEIHKLRAGKAELQKQLEALPIAREQIKRLEQKVENLEAIIDIKGDYEKQLAEKHQQLLRKLDRESKANKRLSMDNEELNWRLSIGSADSPDAMRRSISHSPTQSEASTPDVVRRRPKSGMNGNSPASALPHSPRSPRNSHGYEFESLRSPRSPRDFDRSPTATQHYGHQRTSSNQKLEPAEPVKTGLKRSGTYDLLDQEFDEDMPSGVRQADG